MKVHAGRITLGSLQVPQSCTVRFGCGSRAGCPGSQWWDAPGPGSLLLYTVDGLTGDRLMMIDFPFRLGQEAVLRSRGTQLWCRRIQMVFSG